MNYQDEAQVRRSPATAWPLRASDGRTFEQKRREAIALEGRDPLPDSVRELARRDRRG